MKCDAQQLVLWVSTEWLNITLQQNLTRLLVVILKSTGAEATSPVLQMSMMHSVHLLYTCSEEHALLHGCFNCDLMPMTSPAICIDCVYLWRHDLVHIHLWKFGALGRRIQPIRHSRQYAIQCGSDYVQLRVCPQEWVSHKWSHMTAASLSYQSSSESLPSWGSRKPIGSRLTPVPMHLQQRSMSLLRTVQ